MDKSLTLESVDRISLRDTVIHVHAHGYTGVDRNASHPININQISVPKLLKTCMLLYASLYIG